MLNRKFGIAGILLITLFLSCDFNKKDDCIRLDNDIAAINDSLLMYGSKWGDELKIAVNTLDFSGLRPIRVEMQGFIARKTEYVKGMKNIGGSEKLLKTELEFLETEEEIVKYKLSVFENYDESVVMDELSDAYANMQLSAVKERDLLEKLHRLREDYAEKNEIPKFIEKY